MAWSYEYVWMHCSGVLKDAVASFEVYLEKAREEILRRQAQPIDVPEEAPFFRELEDFYEQIDVDIGADGVGEIRQLRHFLTHRRGELRTEELRRRYAADAAGLGPINVELSEPRVLDAIDVLGRAVRRIDAVVYRHTWEGVALDGL